MSELLSVCPDFLYLCSTQSKWYTFELFFGILLRYHLHFICNALALGIAPQVVMKWPGHSDYKAMKPYIDVCDEIKAEAMKKFDSF